MGPWWNRGLFSIVILCALTVQVQGTNLATTKPTWQSSNRTDSLGRAVEATDGNTSIRWPRCTHTAAQYRPWLAVDLQAAVAVTSVTLWNRDTAPGRLTNFEVRVGNTKPPTSGAWSGSSSGNALCVGHTASLPSNATALACTAAVTGRYVTVQLVGSFTAAMLTICELQVFSAAAG